MKYLLSLSLLVISCSALGQSIPLLMQGSKTYFHFNEKKLKSQSLNKVGIKTYQGMDVQYGRKIKVKGYFLAEALPKPLSGFDSILLHFKNGMRIPIQMVELKSLNPFIATEFFDEIDKKFVKSFPTVDKKDPMFSDPRPISFKTNKVVVGQKIYSLGKGQINPFRYTDSLIKLEWINYQSWIAFSKVKGSQKEYMGREVFLARCQYCHGVNGQGSTYGWDFVSPLPIHTRRNAKSLLLHVKFQRLDALKRGLMMPAQTGITITEAEHLWHWLKAVTDKENGRSR